MYGYACGLVFWELKGWSPYKHDICCIGITKRRGFDIFKIYCGTDTCGLWFCLNVYFVLLHDGIDAYHTRQKLLLHDPISTKARVNLKEIYIIFTFRILFDS